jgi:hypothetical protein
MLLWTPILPNIPTTILNLSFPDLPRISAGWRLDFVRSGEVLPRISSQRKSICRLFKKIGHCHGDPCPRYRIQPEVRGTRRSAPRTLPWLLLEIFLKTALRPTHRLIELINVLLSYFSVVESATVSSLVPFQTNLSTVDEINSGQTVIFRVYKSQNY